MWMSVWPTYAVRSVPISMARTSATAGRATTSRRMAIPVKVQHARSHTHRKHRIHTKRTSSCISLTWFIVLVVQTLMNVPRALAICAPISVWTFQAVTSVLVLTLGTPCLQTDDRAEVNIPSSTRENRAETTCVHSLKCLSASLSSALKQTLNVCQHPLYSS